MDKPALRPFHTNLGAAGWVETNAQGDTSVLLIQQLRRNSIKLSLLRVTYHNTGNPILGAQPVDVQEVPRG